MIFTGVLAQAFSKIFIISEFYVNRDFIAKNLCENRDNPQSTCHGKCHLKKALSDDENHNSPASAKNLKEKQELPLFYDLTRIEVTCIEYPTAIQKYVITNDMRVFTFVKSIFHPPALI